MVSRLDTMAPAAARTSNGTGPMVPTDGDTLSVQVNVTAVSGTSPSLALSVQWSNDGATWSPANPADTFTAITAAGNALGVFTTKAAFARLAWTITGTTPSFTFSATSASIR